MAAVEEKLVAIAKGHKVTAEALAVMSFWSNACNEALGRPLQVLQDIIFGCGGLTVRPAAVAIPRAYLL